MDAASKFKAFLVAAAASFGTISLAYGDDSEPKSPCNGKACRTEVGPSDSVPPEAPSKNGIAAFVSEWLSKSPRFSVGFAVHYGDSEPTANDLPRVELHKIDPKANKAQASSPIANPMRFTQQVSKIQLGELVSDVILSGHRIYSGNKCCDAKEDLVAGKACDASGKSCDAGGKACDSSCKACDASGKACDATEKATVVADEESEQILVLPLAPPPPPSVNIALGSDGSTETGVASILQSSGLGEVSISLPVTTVVDLLVANTELSTRLQMTSQLMDERQASMDTLQSLANRNATLATQLAVAEARNQMSEALTASVMERAELMVKLATLDSTPSKAPSTHAVKTIQEDLSNIRRQIALLRRSPVPFAQSYVGIQPYVPTAQLPTPELTCEGDETTNKVK